MQTVIQPAIDPGQTLLFSRDRPPKGIEIEPGGIGIVVLDSQDRQTPLPTPVVVVIVVRAQPR